MQEAQVQNYETQRAEFEAYIDHSTNKDAPSTGIVYWQLNKGWPTLLWDLYNNDFDQAGSYFGAKKANERAARALHVRRRVGVGRQPRQPRPATGCRSCPTSTASTASCSTTRPRRACRSAGQGVARNVLHPAVPAATTPPTPAKTYFVELLLERHGKVVDRNVYWLSTQQDVVDWDKTIGNPQATMTQFANLSQLQSLPAAAVRVRAHSESARADGLEKTVVTITNTSTKPTVAFFLRADVRRGNAVGDPGAGRQRGAADLLVRQRRHAVAGRVRDAAGQLPARRPARRRAGGQRVGVELAATGRAGVVTSASS